MNAESDPLIDEGKADADARTAAGGQVQYNCYPGMLHGLARMGGLIDMAGEALADGASALRQAFKV